MSEFLSLMVDFVWGPVLVILLFGGGLYLLFRSAGKALLYIPLGLKLLFGLSNFGHDEKSTGELTHFKALSNALAATVGLGNIAGVAVAISQGGPGSLFWMWVSGFVGMNTKFFESTLSIMFRGKDFEGNVQGGPMYYIPKVFKGSFGKYAGVFFAVMGLIGTQAVFQTNQLASYLHDEVHIDNWITGIVMSVTVGIVLLGGLKRIARVTSSIVPLMCVIYVISCVVILFFNINKIPEMFTLIFTEAFSGRSVAGGVGGYAFIHVFRTGIKRGVFSNEAGAGTAPMAHGDAKTSEPVAEGLVAMVGPLVDTLIVCTMTGLVILTSIDLTSLDLNSVEGVSLTSFAFKKSLGSFGGFLLGLSIFFFSFSTMIGMANYNEKCWKFLFKGRGVFKRPLFILLFCGMLFLGAVAELKDMVNILDIGFGLMAYPNMLALLVGAPIVILELKKKLCS